VLGELQAWKLSFHADPGRTFHDRRHFFRDAFSLSSPIKPLKVNTAKLLHWLPRIICIAAILFISLFALDAFTPGAPIWQQIGGFLMHLAPSFILAIILAIAWKRELAGGILFTAIGVIMTPFIFNINHDRNQFSIEQSIGIVLMITFPFIVVGVLFIMSYYRSRKTA
jgi:hypothetical protein